jgi:hypothetical protein
MSCEKYATYDAYLTQIVGIACEEDAFVTSSVGHWVRGGDMHAFYYSYLHA